MEFFQRALAPEKKTMLKRLRTYLSQIFKPHLYTPEGFRLSKQRYILQQDTINLPSGEKRAITICNLFSNEDKGIDEIAKLLDTTRRMVIADLIHEGLILDRRTSNLKHKLERRQTAKYHLALVLPTGQIDQFRALCGQFGSETVSEFVFKTVLKREERCEECRKRYERVSDGRFRPASEL
jgi:hypothetical protein